jgi:MSHA biogenesis protein MshJ
MTWRMMRAKYEAMSLRERAMIALAALAVIIALWDSLLMTPLTLARTGLQSELATMSDPNSQSDSSDPRQVSLTRAGELQLQMQQLDGELITTTSGFVSSDRMIEVLHDVLGRQGRLQLVSIRNLPVSSLIPPADANTPAVAPYVHSIELVIEGQYGDVLEYLGALEALPWKFRWNSLDLSTAGYPKNRVRIELSTLSMDATWLGV